MEKVLSFLKKLSKNNNRDWFLENKKEYEAAKGQVLDLATYVIKELAKKDADLIGLEAKNCIFRINRDIRFSNDKSPYKTNMGMWMARGGKKSQFAGYYVHLEPGNSFIAGGCYQPEPDTLKAIRQEIDYNYTEITKLLSAKKLKETFGSPEMEYQGKATPKGYSADNPAIELLKLKSFIFSSKLSDKELNDPVLSKRIVTDLSSLTPVIHFLNKGIETSEG